MNKIDMYEQIPVGEAPVRILDYTNMPYNFILHWHEHIEIHYIFEGEIKLRCGEDILDVNKGDCIVINSNELHEGLSGSCSYICMLLPPAFFCSNYVIMERKINDEHISELFNKIIEQYRSKTKVSTLYINGYASLLAGCLVEKYSKEELSESRYRKYVQKAEKINEAVTYINNNCTCDVRTKELSDMVHLSEGHFCNLFKAVTGKTAKDYILNLRLDKAKDLLKDTDMTITEICYCCGFSDPNYFARIFKKKIGLSPSSFRG